MRCKALAVFDNIDKNCISIHIPNKSSTSFWAKAAARTIETIIRQEIQALYHELESGYHIAYPSNIGFIHVQKLNRLCCVIITDTELKPEQVKYLTLYLLCKQISLRTIANNLEQYSQDYRAPVMKKALGNLFDTLQLMHKQLERAISKQIRAANDFLETESDFASLSKQKSIWSTSPAFF